MLKNEFGNEANEKGLYSLIENNLNSSTRYSLIVQFKRQQHTILLVAYKKIYQLTFLLKQITLKIG